MGRGQLDQGHDAISHNRPGREKLLRASLRPPGDNETREKVPTLMVSGLGAWGLQNHDQSGPGPCRQG